MISLMDAETIWWRSD